LGAVSTEELISSTFGVSLRNRYVLVNSSQAFGGFYSNDPRQIYAEFRLHFHH
jgi:hypothetical protein